MPPKTRKSAEARRDEILTRAIALLARNGFQDTSFQKIANAIGVSQSAILHHYPTKEALLEDAVTRIVTNNHELVAATLKPTDDAVTRLRKYFTGNLDWSIKFRGEAQVILVLYHLAAFSPRFTTLYRRVLEGGRGRVTELVAAGVREGAFPKRLDIETAGISLHDMVVGAIISAICLPADAAEARRMKKRWDEALERLSR